MLKDLSFTIPRYPRNPLELLDDAGFVRIDNVRLLIKVDGYAFSRALYPWCSFRDLGFRSVTAAVSDVITKGCRPVAYAVSIGIPESSSEEIVREIVNGVCEAVRFYGGYLENLDTNVGKDGWIDVFIVGECRVDPIPRSAESSNVLVVPSRIGLGGIAYLSYVNNENVCNDVLEHSCRPRISMNLVRVLEEFREGIAGSIDISDTFFETLTQLVEARRLGIYIDVNPSDLLHPRALSYARERSIDPITLAMMTCEEYVPVLAVRSSYVEDLVDTLRSYGFEPVVLGRVINAPIISWRGEIVKPIYWSHKQGSIVVEH